MKGGDFSILWVFRGVFIKKKSKGARLLGNLVLILKELASVWRFLLKRESGCEWPVLDLHTWHESWYILPCLHEMNSYEHIRKHCLGEQFSIKVYQGFSNHRKKKTESGGASYQGDHINLTLTGHPPPLAFKMRFCSVVTWEMWKGCPTWCRHRCIADI